MINFLKYTVQVLLKDSPTAHHYEHVSSVHQEGDYTVLWVSYDLIYRFPTQNVQRLKMTSEAN